MNGFFELRKDKLMDKRDLATLCKALRGMKGLTQEEVAERLGALRGSRISKQSISVAENPDKPGVDALRIEIVEMLSGRQLDGPYWKFKDEPAGEVG